MYYFVLRNFKLFSRNFKKFHFLERSIVFKSHDIAMCWFPLWPLLPALQCSDLTFNLTASAEQCNPFSKSNLIKKHPTMFLVKSFLRCPVLKKEKLPNLMPRIISQKVSFYHFRSSGKNASWIRNWGAEMSTKRHNCAQKADIALQELELVWTFCQRNVPRSVLAAQVLVRFPICHQKQEGWGTYR